MPRHRIALVGLGMAVTPHAKSLLDLRDRAEVAGGWCRVVGGPQGTTLTFWMPRSRPS